MALHRLLKRKRCVDEVNDDFPLSSPATKIRRLDAELPPIVEEDELLPSPSSFPSPNDERALVLFKPLAHSPSSISFTVDSDLIKEIHDTDNSNTELMEDDEMEEGVGSMMMDIETDSDPKTCTSSIHYPTTHSGIAEGFQLHRLLPRRRLRPTRPP